jgi:hypothetical protein
VSPRLRINGHGSGGRHLEYVTMSEPDANTCTRINSHGYKRTLHTQTTTKGFKLSARFQWVKGVSLILN